MINVSTITICSRTTIVVSRRLARIVNRCRRPNQRQRFQGFECQGFLQEGSCIIHLCVDEFYQSRKGDWETLSRLLDQSQTDMSGLSEGQVRDLARLYRATTSDLALAKRDFPVMRSPSI